MTISGQTDFLKNLVIFIIILTAVATVIALVLYFWAIAPVQKMEQLSPPTNTQYRDNSCEKNWVTKCVEKQQFACTFE